MTRTVITESMRIGGKKVSADGVVPVHYPFTNEIIGTVPAGRAEHAARAFEIAAGFKPKLTRYERQQILFRRRNSSASAGTPLPMSSHLSWISMKIWFMNAGGQRFSLAAQLCILDDARFFPGFTPQGSRAKFTKRDPVGVISAITPFNHPLNMVSHKRHCHEQLCGASPGATSLTALALADILTRACRRKCTCGHRQSDAIGDEMVTTSYRGRHFYRRAVVTAANGLRAARAWRQ
jgi:hypothetical protein